MVARLDREKNSMGRKHIYDKDSFYNFLKPLVDWCTKRSYRKIRVYGKENLPKDGTILLAPNHTNTLMDALVMLQASSKPTVFGARADMFNKPFIAKLMYFFRILPMVRQRDGLRNVLKNHESFNIIVETLENEVQFCMYPEGRHRPAHSLLPLGKGVMRAVVAANDKFGDKKPVYIVPVGIEYGDYFRYRSTCMVTYGQPINVTEFIKGRDVENDAQLMDPLRKELRQKMSELITFIPDDENLAAKWSLTKILTASFRSSDLRARKDNNQKSIDAIEAAMTTHPEQMADILSEAAKFDKDRRKAKVSIFSFGAKNPMLNALGKALLALLGLPYFLFSLVAALPMWIIALLLRGKIRDKAFGNTVSFGIKLGLGPIWYPIVFALAFIFAPWQYALGISILAIPTYNYFYDYTEFVRRMFSDFRLSSRKDLIKRFLKIRKSFSELK